ncbi:hypothetical protein [Cupriavidus sp. RAF12]|uniref:hypothetical protein n=1 Tax=Cupriavidus sp. RAF12 TaxID=3233050 RepID=UPI003F8E20BB
MSRTDQEIVDQTERAAAMLAASDSYFLQSGTYRDSKDPRVQRYWAKACEMQELLTNTDVYNAMANLDIDNAHGEWAECQRIADISEVHELLQDFTNDPTGDAGTMIVREIRRVVLATVPAPRTGESGDARDAKRWRTLEKALRTRLPGPAHGRRLKVVEVCPAFGDKEVANLTAVIDAATEHTNG